MTTITTTEPIALCGDALPCADCGQEVAVPNPATVVKSKRTWRGHVSTVLMTKCQACDERDRAAADLARRHLRPGVTVGDRRYSGTDAVRLLIEARTAFDAAGVQPPSIGTAKNPAAALTAEVHHLSASVRGLRWRDRLNPPQSLVAEPVSLVLPGTANSRPWAHLDEPERARLVHGTAGVLAERVALQAPPVHLRPPRLPGEDGGQRGTPVTGGCLYCGVDSISLTALVVARHGGADAAARSVWTLRQLNPVSIGATRGGPPRLQGWLCPACERAAAGAGSASSASAMEYALSTFLGVSSRSLAGDELWVAGLQGWGAIVADALQRHRSAPSPNSSPWGHLSQAELDELACDWRRGGSGG